jgi:hypothetical protein
LPNVVVRALGGSANALGLQDFSNLVELPQVVLGVSAGPGAAIRGDLDQSFTFEPDERFSDRGLADPEA